MEITAKELRHQVRKVLDTVSRGEAVTVTYRGKRAARIEGIAEAAPAPDLTQAPAFGLWDEHDDMNDISTHIDRLRAPRD